MVQISAFLAGKDMEQVEEGANAIGNFSHSSYPVCESREDSFSFQSNFKQDQHHRGPSEVPVDPAVATLL